MHEQIAQWALESIYGTPVEMASLDVDVRINSVRLRVTPKSRNLNELLIKCIRPQFQEGHLEDGVGYLPSIALENQNRFRETTGDPIRTPRALLADDSRGLFVAEFVSGTNLKSYLTKFRRPRYFDLPTCMRLAGQALAAWHALNNAKPLAFTEDPDKNRNAEVMAFLDFSVWNILLPPGGKTICVVDFPGSRTWARRHRDLATFLHSLLVLKLHPPALLNPLPWWSWESAYASFITGYSESIGIKLVHSDYKIIQQELHQLVRREATAYNRYDGSLFRRIEARWYSTLFSHPALRSASLLDLIMLRNKHSGK